MKVERETDGYCQCTVRRIAVARQQKKCRPAGKRGKRQRSPPYDKASTASCPSPPSLNRSLSISTSLQTSPYHRVPAARISKPVTVQRLKQLSPESPTLRCPAYLPPPPTKDSLMQRHLWSSEPLASMLEVVNPPTTIESSRPHPTIAGRHILVRHTCAGQFLGHRYVFLTTV